MSTCSLRPFKRVLSTVAGFAIAAAAQSAFSQALPDKIRIGILNTMTGPAAASFFSATVAYRMALRDVNDRGGIAGRPVELVWADAAYPNTTQVVAEAQRLANAEKVAVILGPPTSQEVLAVAPILTKAKILSLSTAATSALNATVSPYGFSVYQSAPAIAEAIVAYAANGLKVKNVAIMLDTGSMSRDAAEPLRSAAKAAGLSVTGEQSHNPNDPDLTPQLLNLRRGIPQAILHFASAGQDLGRMLRGMKDIGWDVPIVSQTAALNFNSVLPIAGADTYKAGRIAGITYSAMTYCKDTPIGSMPFSKWAVALREFDPVSYPKVAVGGMAFNYDAMFIVKAAIEATQSVDGEVLSKWLLANASRLQVVSGKLQNPPPPTRHLFGADVFAVTAHPDTPRSDLLTQRGGC